MVIFCHLCAREKMSKGGAKLVAGRCLQLLSITRGLCRNHRYFPPWEEPEPLGPVKHELGVITF